MTRGEEYLAHFQHRLMQHALAEAEAATWRRRAATFDWAKPNLGDFRGEAGSDSLKVAWRRCDAVARACRARAELAEILRRDEIEAGNRALDDPNLEDVIWRLQWEQGRFSSARSEAAA